MKAIRKTKKALREEFRSYLYKYPVNSDVDMFDFPVLLSMFKSNHPFWHIKEGCGIEKISIRKDQYNNRGFFLTRKDGSITDIGIGACVDGVATVKKRIKRACRTAILNTIQEFKKSVNFGVDKCPFNGEVLTKENTHIDHYNLEFNDLFKKWISNKNIDDLKNSLNDDSKDLVMSDWFTDQSITDDFIKFHNSNTHLRAISAKANLSTRKRK